MNLTAKIGILCHWSWHNPSHQNQGWFFRIIPTLFPLGNSISVLPLERKAYGEALIFQGSLCFSHPNLRFLDFSCCKSRQSEVWAVCEPDVLGLLFSRGAGDGFKGIFGNVLLCHGIGCLGWWEQRGVRDLWNRLGWEKTLKIMEFNLERLEGKGGSWRFSKSWLRLFPDIHENWAVLFYPSFLDFIHQCCCFVGIRSCFLPQMQPQVVFMDCRTLAGFPGLCITGSSQMIHIILFFFNVLHGIPGFWKIQECFVCVVGWTSHLRMCGIHSMKILSCVPPNPFFSGKLENPLCIP